MQAIRLAAISGRTIMDAEVARAIGRINEYLDLIENASHDLRNYRVAERIQHKCDEIRAELQLPDDK